MIMFAQISSSGTTSLLELITLHSLLQLTIVEIKTHTSRTTLVTLHGQQQKWLDREDRSSPDQEPIIKRHAMRCQDSKPTRIG